MASQKQGMLAIYTSESLNYEYVLLESSSLNQKMLFQWIHKQNEEIKMQRILVTCLRSNASEQKIKFSKFFLKG